jgi:hypothetical protein
MFSLVRKVKFGLLIAVVACLFGFAAFALMPQKIHAQTNTASAEDIRCQTQCAIQQQLATEKKQPQLACIPQGATSLFCASPSSGGVAAGHCEMSGCKATHADGVGGQGDAMKGLGDLAKQVGDILGKLMQGGGGGGGGDSPTPPTTPTTGTCTGSYYGESTTLAPTDPCAYYVPPGGTTVGTTSSNTSAQDLLNALHNTTGNNLLNLLSGSTTPGTAVNNNNNNTNTSSSTNLNGDVTTANVTGSFNPNNPNNTNPNQPVATNTTGLSGSIQTTATGATFVTNQVQGNSETSSFFGGDGITGFVSNVISSWCISRPWAIGFIASIIPPTFFDGLCKSNGFALGSTAATATNTINATNPNGIKATQGQGYVNLTQTPVQQSSNTTAPATRPIVHPITVPTTVIPGRVDIWAVPPSVALGARTTIFWNTENVSNCTETSPDGSFRQTSLSGGAATVPLTESTTFTISCLDLGHNPTTDYVTVNIGN